MFPPPSTALGPATRWSCRALRRPASARRRLSRSRARLRSRREPRARAVRLHRPGAGDGVTKWPRGLPAGRVAPRCQAPRRSCLEPRPHSNSLPERPCGSSTGWWARAWVTRPEPRRDRAAGSGAGTRCASSSRVARNRFPARAAPRLPARLARGDPGLPARLPQQPLDKRDSLLSQLRGAPHDLTQNLRVYRRSPRTACSPSS
jgi:hypothetical protein